MRFRFSLNSAEQGSLVLEKEPKGWKDIEVMLKRSLEYHGIFYEAMAQLEFTCRSGKEFIDTEIELRGVDAVVNILIQVSCQSGSGSIEAPDYSIDYSDDYGSMASGSGAPVFETLFEGVLNLANYRQTSEATIVDLIQSDFVQKVINRFDTKINIDENVDLDSNPVTPLTGIPYQLTLPSKAILFQSEFESTEGSDSIVTPFDNDVMAIEYPLIVIMDELTGSIDNSDPYIHTSLRSGSEFGLENTEPIYFNDSPDPITFTVEFNFQGTLQVRNSKDSLVDFSVVFQKGGTEFSFAGYPIHPYFQVYNIVDNIIINDNIVKDIFISVSDTFTVTLDPGHKLFLINRVADVEGSEISPGLFEFIGLTFSTFSLKLSNVSLVAETQSLSYPVYETGVLISQRITGLEAPFRSTLLGRKNSQPETYDSNGCFSFAAITSGKKIRVFPPEESNTFISMGEYFKTLNAINNTGLSFEKEDDNYVIRLEEKEYFYSNTVLLQCPNARNIRIGVAKEYYVSDIAIGYQKWENEEVNGIDEFNSKREYNTGIKAISNKIDLMSPIIGSAYAAEFTRRKSYLRFPTVDWKYDDDNFIFCLNRSVDGDGVPNNLTTVEKDENYSVINNVFSPQNTYNYRISPARNLLRHLSVIGGSLTKYLTRVVKFVYGEGNYLAETEFTNDTCPGNFNNELLSESQDIPWNGSGADPIWIPEYIDFDYPVTFSEWLTIKANPRGCIEVSKTDTDFMKGFIIDVRYKPVGGIATFKLLRAWQSE